MALKEHPFVVTSSFTADGDTITYDKNVENRSTAVGKAFKINAAGKAELVADGDEIVGKVLAVDDDNVMTGAYICGGLRLPIGDSQTVERGTRIVGALGADDAKGYIKTEPVVPAAAAELATDATEDHTDSTLTDNATIATAINATNTALNSTAEAVNDLRSVVGLTVNRGRGLVVDFDDTDALVALI